MKWFWFKLNFPILPLENSRWGNLIHKLRNIKTNTKKHLTTPDTLMYHFDSPTRHHWQWRCEKRKSQKSESAEARKEELQIRYTRKDFSFHWAKILIDEALTALKCLEGRRNVKALQLCLCHKFTRSSEIGWIVRANVFGKLFFFRYSESKMEISLINPFLRANIFQKSFLFWRWIVLKDGCQNVTQHKSLS